MHNGTFENVSEESNAGIYVNSMAIATYDYENDGDMDIYVTNIDEGNKFLKIMEMEPLQTTLKGLAFYLPLANLLALYISILIMIIGQI